MTVDRNLSKYEEIRLLGFEPEMEAERCSALGVRQLGFQSGRPSSCKMWLADRLLCRPEAGLRWSWG